MLHKHLDALAVLRELGSHGGTVTMFELLIERTNALSTTWKLTQMSSSERLQLCAARDRSLAFLRHERDKVERGL